MPKKRSITDYLEAGGDPSMVRAQRRWRAAGFALQLGLAVAVIAPSVIPVEQPKPEQKKVTKLVEPRFETPKPPEVKPPAPPPKLAVRTIKVPEIRPEVPPEQRIAPERVELGAPTFEIVDDRDEMKQVLARFQGAIAFSAKDDYGFYTSRFRAPDWHAEPVPDGIESAGLYCSFDVPGFPVPKNLCREKNIPCESNAYAAFPKSQCALIYQDIKRFAGDRGLTHVRNVRIRFSATAPSGFEVVDVTGSQAQTLQDEKGHTNE